MKYLISSLGIDQIIRYGSSHPKRKKLLDDASFNPSDQSYLFRLRYLHAPRSLNIFVGDSHAEFFTRRYLSTGYYFLARSFPISYHTGATTLYGALNSHTYFDDVAKSILLLKDVFQTLNHFNRINICISLGEIDLRTKIYLLCLNSFDANAIRDPHFVSLLVHELYHDRLAETLATFRKKLNELLGPSLSRVSLVMPPPPSKGYPFQQPNSYDQGQEILRLVSYPRFGDYKMRVLLWRALNDVMCSVSSKLGSSFMVNLLYYDTLNLIDAWTDDGCHVSRGQAFECNSYTAYNFV